MKQLIKTKILENNKTISMMKYKFNVPNMYLNIEKFDARESKQWHLSVQYYW